VTGFLVGLYSLAVMTLTTRWRGLPARLVPLFREPASLRDLLRRRTHVDDVARQEEPTRRRRLAPMAALMACALIVLMLSHWLRGTS
jgi:hypothetical protein